MKRYKDKCFASMVWILRELEKESSRQIEKWGIQDRTAFEWLTYLTEELGSLAKAISEHEYRGATKDKVIAEAFQVATLALKIAEMYKHEQ